MHYTLCPTITQLRSGLQRKSADSKCTRQGMQSISRGSLVSAVVKGGGVAGKALRLVLWHAPLCEIPSGRCLFTGPWTVTRSSLRMLRQVAAFCWPLRPVLLLVSFPHSRGPVVGVPGLCGMWRDVPFARQQRPVVGILGLCWLLWGSLDCFCCPHTSVLRPSTTCLAVFPCA